jgi:RNA polymerase sigma factor (sigma-70 family)
VEQARDGASVGGVSGARDEGELAQFCALLDESAATITRIAAALVGVADAEDAAQEAILRAWRAWRGLRDRESARAWLTSITVNVCRDWLRGRFGAQQRLTESLAEMDGEPRALARLDTDPGASDHAAALDLRAALNTLDEDLRLVVLLRYYAGLDSNAIGAALGVPAATARTRLRRALGLLRERLSGAGYPASPHYSTDTSDTTEGRR